MFVLKRLQTTLNVSSDSCSLLDHSLCGLSLENHWGVGCGSARSRSIFEDFVSCCVLEGPAPLINMNWTISGSPKVIAQSSGFQFSLSSLLGCMRWMSAWTMEKWPLRAAARVAFEQRAFI